MPKNKLPQSGYHHEFITRKKELGKDRWGFVVKQLRGRIGKREPHPNFAKYLGVLIENGKETIVLHEGMDYVEAVTRTRIQSFEWGKAARIPSKLPA